MAASTTDTREQVYNVREDDQLSSGVALVTCVLAQREIYIAGFSINKELLTIHYSDYSSNKPVWELDFFEQLFASEPLLAVREKVRGIFVASNRNLIVPDELYSETAAAGWLRKLHFVERQEALSGYALENDRATYIQALPLNIAELIRINFRKATVRPLPYYQFCERPAMSLHLQLCFTKGQCIATLHNYSQLLWHSYIDYSCAEDVAYALRHYCKENYIDAGKLHITCNALAASEFDTINELSRYFTIVKAGNGLTINNPWTPPVTLANQLLECV